MYDIEALEEEWRIYNRKRNQSKYMVVASALAVLSLSVATYKYFENSKIEQLKAQNSYDISADIVTDRPLVAIALKKKIDTTPKEVKPKTVSVEDAGPMSYVNKVDDSIDSKEIKKPLVTDVTEEVRPKKKVHLDIIETSNANAYKDVEKRFNASHSISDALFLARNYYSRGIYEKASYWAIECNKINDKLEESWLIFAKSKAKLGQKHEAINALKVYIKRTSSGRAKNILKKIEEGTL